MKLILLAAAMAMLAAAEDWPMYLRDPAHHSFNSAENIIGRDTVAQLTPVWTFAASAAIGVGVTAVDGVLYFGAWDGKFYAVNASDGKQLWSQFVGKAPNSGIPGCMPGIGVESQAVVLNGIVWVGGGDSAFYGLDQKTGAIRARVPLADPAAGAYLWSSVTYANGALYIGIASLGDCPLVRGGLARIDPADPTHPLIMYLVPPDGEGSSVWSTPAVDEQAGLVYVTTGNGDQDAALGLWGSAMLALDAVTLEIKAHFFLPVKPDDADVDWGSSPTLINAPDGTPLVVANGKDGVMYALRRPDLQPVWTLQIAVDCAAPEIGCGSVSSPAFDGKTIFSGAGDSDPNLNALGTVYSIDPQSGIVLWKKATDGVVLGPVTVANGVVFASSNKGFMAFDAATGDALWNDARGTSSVSQPVLVDGTLYTTYLSGEVVAWRPFADRSITPSGVVDAASFSPPVAPGGLFSIFGANMAAGVRTADAVPLPSVLADVNVTFNGVPAALLYVSPAQINGQVPMEIGPGQAEVLVNREGLGAGTTRANIAATAPALFTYSDVGSVGFAVALNADYTVNFRETPAAPGDIVLLFLTGAGAVTPAVPNGVPAPLDPLSYVKAPVTARIGDQPADVLFAGLAPTFVGLIQVNVRVPDIPSGYPPVTVTIGGVPSNSPSIVVRTN